MERLIPLIAVVVKLAGLPVLVMSGTAPKDSNISDSELTIRKTEVNNSLASATITIIMTNTTSK